MHIYTLCPSLLQNFRKFCWAVSVELCWPTVSVVSFIFVKFRSSKRGIAPRKKFESKCSVDMHIHTLCPSLLKVSRNSVEWFQRICANKKNSSIFQFGQISKFKKGVTLKKNGIKISYGYAQLHIMSFITTKFHEILLSGFRGVALTRKTGLTDWLTNWLTDGQVKNIIPFATRCMGYKKIFYKATSNETLYISFRKMRSRIKNHLN